MVLELSSATFSSNVYHCILLVSLYVIHVILLLEMFTIMDYSSALEYSIIRRYTNIVILLYILLLLYIGLHYTWPHWRIHKIVNVTTMGLMV